MAVHGAAIVALLALAQGWAPGAAFNNELLLLEEGVSTADTATTAQWTEKSLLGAFREATARVLEAAHGWLNCLLSARPRPPADISKCIERALPAVVDVLVALSTAGWAARFKALEEVDAIHYSTQRMAELRAQVHSCVDTLKPSLQMAGRCYTVI